MNAACFPTHVRKGLAKGLALAAVTACVGVVPCTSEAVEPLPGKYSGKTGTTGRISFKVNSRGNKIQKLNVSIFALGQDDYGTPTTFQLIASATDGKSFRLKRSGRFTASGVDKNGIRYKVSGKLKGKRKFKGTAEMSWYHFSYFGYNAFTGFFDIPVYELVSGSRPYTAKR